MQNCKLNKRTYRDIGFQKINNENLRAENFTLDTNFGMITRQTIIECNLLSNYFYRSITSETTWFNQEIDTKIMNFKLIGPKLD